MALSGGHVGSPTYETVQLSGIADILKDEIHPDVLSAAVFDASALPPVLADITKTQNDLDTARSDHARLEKDLALFRKAESPLRAKVAQAETERVVAVKAAATADKALESFAISNFKRRDISIDLTAGDSKINRNAQRLAKRLDAEVLDAQRKSVENRVQKETIFRTLDSAESVLLARISTTIKQSDEQVKAIAAAEKHLTVLAAQAVSEVLAAPLVGLPFPLVVLDAYYRAEALTMASRPACQVSWYQLAGIGKVETHHGTYRGASVQTTGETSTPILGPELNGGPFMAISDTDGGELDNNPVWDHAVGPMQFIPSSWKLFGDDGNGDSVNDPHNMYDAALAAANHLCGSRSGLSSTDNFTSALLGYNRSTSYGHKVKQYSSDYAQALSL